MKNRLYFFASLMILVFFVQDIACQQSFYDFTVMDIHGEEFDMAQLKGKKVLVVNTASKCALTPQYKDLEKLYRKYGDEAFMIIGFPSNDFASQEPGTNEEIANFCEQKYNITFPIMSKITIKGSDKHPIYQWLTEKSKNGVEDSNVKWNFQKYMIDENGVLVGNVVPRKKPYTSEIIDWLK